MAQPLTLTLRITADGRRLVTEVLRAEGALEQLAAAEGKAAREAERASAETARMGAEATAAAGRLGRLGAALRRTFEGRRHIIQQVAFQLQDVVTQLQLGAPAAQVLAVQGGQIAQAFGPLGTILGTAAGAVLGLAGAFFSLRQEVEPTVDLLDETIGLFGNLTSAARRYARALENATAEKRRFLQVTAEEDLGAALRRAESIIGELGTAVRDETAGSVGFELGPEPFVDLPARDLEDRLREAVRKGDADAVLRVAREHGLLPQYREAIQQLAALADEVLLNRLVAEARTGALRDLAGGRGGRGSGGGSGGGGSGGSGGGRRHLARDVLADLAFEVAARERLLQAIRAGASAYEEETARIEAERIARRAGIDLQSQEFRQLLDLVRTRRSLSELLDAEQQKRRRLAAAARAFWESERREAERAARELERVSREIAGSIARGFLDAARGVRSFGDVAEEVLSRLAERLIELSIVRPLEDSLSGLLNGFLSNLFGPGSSGASASYAHTANAIYAAGTSPFAKGGVLEDGALVRFARGGVVDRPLFFPLRHGAGLMGEAGPEAILPLTRLPSGDLGVRARSAPVRLEVRIVNRTGDVDVDAREVPAAGDARILEIAIDRRIERGLQRMAETAGLDPILRAYGVRRVPV